MISYKFLKDNGIVPKSIRKINNSYVVESFDKKYFFKKNSSDVDKYFNYLVSRNFNYFPNYFKLGDYNVYDYIDNIDDSTYENLYDIVDLISLLHMKTVRYRNTCIDDYKIIYEAFNEKLNDLNNYYVWINDIIDNDIYMSPSKYLLVLNISKIYNAISFCRRELDNWYDMVKDKPNQRECFIHNNLSLDHFVRGVNPYLISWDKAKFDFPINDFYDLYSKYYEKVDFDVLFNSYRSKFSLTEDELKLFFIKISMPFKIEFDSDEYSNVLEVKRLISYIENGDKIISPYYINKETQ